MASRAALRQGRGDPLELRVRLPLVVRGAASHELVAFFRRLEGDALTVTGERIFDPDEVYGKS